MRKQQKIIHGAQVQILGQWADAHFQFLLMWSDESLFNFGLFLLFYLNMDMFTVHVLLTVSYDTANIRSRR